MSRSIYVIFLICISKMLNGQAVDLKSGMTVSLNFNSNVEDISGANNHGVLNDTFYRKDRFDNCEFALGFDEYLQLATISESAFQSLNDFSVALWIKNETNGFATVMSVANSLRDNEFNINILSDGRIASNVYNWPNVPGIRIEGSESINDGNWHHVVITRKGSDGETAIYVDGRLDIKGAMPLGVIEVGGNGFVLGNDQDCLAGCYSANQQFFGAIDDLRVYNRLVNQDEIEALFQFKDGEINNSPMGSYKSMKVCTDQVELSIGRNFDTYSWNTGSQSSSIVVNSSGRYVVTGNVKDCVFSDTTDVILNSLPSLSIVSDSDNLKCKESILIEATEGFDSYEWQDGTLGRVYSATMPGVYSVTGYASCGERVSNTVEIVRSDDLTLELFATKLEISCKEVSIISATSGFTSYKWSNGETGSSIEVDKSGVFEVVVTDECGTEFVEQIEIFETAEPNLELSYSKLKLSCGETINVSASDGFREYKWSNGSLGKDLVIDSPGRYTLTAISDCNVVLEESINVISETDITYFIPNTFTPNNDGVNETFEIDYRLVGSTLNIYNRWGKKLYSKDSYQNNWKAEGLESSNYYYQITSDCLDFPIKGWVKVLR
ncbi:LamG-like jellyroll fold domain-containing protein [Roseivirga pacifica]|nr:LamG-like jellyroll fold domain-containing protein [Roseivirga pacifica]